MRRPFLFELPTCRRSPGPTGYHRLLEAIQQWGRGGRRHCVCSRSSSAGHRLVAITDHVANRLPALDAWAARSPTVLEVVRETQAHAPERAGVGQKLPRDGFAPIAPQIGNVTAQRIPHQGLVTLEGPGAKPAALDAHREPVRECVVHPDQHLLANQPVGHDALETACRGREILANIARVGQPLAGGNRGRIGIPRPQTAIGHRGRPAPNPRTDIGREPTAGPNVPIQVREQGVRGHAAEVVRRRLELLIQFVGGDAARATAEAGHGDGLVVGGGAVEVFHLRPHVAPPRARGVGPEAIPQRPAGVQARRLGELVDPVVATIRSRAIVRFISRRLRHRCILRIDELVAHTRSVVGQPGDVQGRDHVRTQFASQIPALPLRRTRHPRQHQDKKPHGRDSFHGHFLMGIKIGVVFQFFHLTEETLFTITFSW